MPQICQIECLMAAWKRVRANKGAAGVDLMTIQHFEANLHRNLETLAEALREERYYPLPLKRFHIAKPNGQTRPLAILAVEDRIVQRAVVDVLEPIFESIFLECSYGYRTGRKVDDAVQRVLQYRAQGYDWVVDGDIRDFFGSLDHRLLMRFLAEWIKDRQVLRLIQMWLDLGAMRPARTTGRFATALALFDQTKQYVGGALERMAEETLARERAALWDMEAPHASSPPDAAGGEWQLDLRREYLKRLRRDGLLLLLTYAQGARKLLTPWGLGITASALLVGLTAPAVGRAIAERRRSAVGTVQGAVISSLLANLYMHHFDRLLVKQGYALVRFGDDFVICCPTEARATEALEAARRRLEELQLTLHPEKTKIVRFDDGFTFLGHAFGAQGSCPQPIHISRSPFTSVSHVLKSSAQASLQRGKALLHRVRPG